MSDSRRLEVLKVDYGWENGSSKHQNQPFQIMACKKTDEMQNQNHDGYYVKQRKQH